MENRPRLTNHRAQLYGSVTTIAVVLACGLLGVLMLGDQLEDARIEAEQARNVSWVRSVVSIADSQSVVSELIEVSDLVRFGSVATGSIVKFHERGMHRATAMKFAAPEGYNGDIWLAVAIDEKGSIIGLKVLSHQETPGFGDVITNADSPWTSLFLGRSLGDPEPSHWRLRSDGGDIDGVSGATITASAVVAGIYSALSYLDQTMANAK